MIWLIIGWNKTNLLFTESNYYAEKLLLSAKSHKIRNTLDITSILIHYCFKFAFFEVLKYLHLIIGKFIFSKNKNDIENNKNWYKYDIYSISNWKH